MNGEGHRFTECMRGPWVALVSGVLLALCLPKPGLCWLAWAAPAGLLWALARARGPLQAAAWAGLAGFGFCAAGLNWIYFTCRFAGVPVPVAALALGALAGVLSLSWAAFGAGANFLSGRYPPAAVPWVLAAWWTAVESAGAHWTPRVGVDLLAYTQWRNQSLIQIGALLGPHALGFLIVLWGGALAQWLQRRGKRESATMAAAFLLVAACWGCGRWALMGRTTPVGPSAAVEILQPDIDQYRKWDGRFEDAIRGRFEGLMALPRERAPGLIVWPESAVPGWLDADGNLDWAAGLARKASAPMIVGAVTREGAQSHNSAVLIGADGTVSGLYHKRRLVPFGEFVPLRGFFQPWIGILAQMGDFDAGSLRQAPMLTPWGKTAATICYEAVFPHLSRIDSSRGARMFVNLTNDGWYKDTWGPYQHFRTNVFRAVENRAFVVRAANTGISGVIDPYGTVLGSSELNARDRLSVDLSLGDPFPEGSLFSRTGDAFGFAAMLASLLLLAVPLARKRVAR